VAQLEESGIRVILLDIEGTTTPADFVYKTLFPYGSSKLEPFLREYANDPEVESIVRDLHRQQEDDERAGLHPPSWREPSEEERVLSSIAYAQWLMSRDSKCTPLKTLQGKIWEFGYANGELKGEVYPDVPRAFERWRRKNKKICIYSSGSALAQQLLFRNTPLGDLTAYISVFFDTRVGAKTEAESFKKIALSFFYAPAEFLFVSDVEKEITAARSAGMQALLCVRNPAADSSHTADGVIQTFDEMFPE
jgi:enolase-phosphatase E1